MLTELEAQIAIRRWFDAALHAVDPANAVCTSLSRVGRALVLDGETIPVSGRVFVAAIGKAALDMARGAVKACGDLIDSGVIITKDGHLSGAIPRGFEAYEAAHPIPDQRGIDATNRLLERLAEAGPGDVVLALISGGGSALMESPVDGVSLAEIATTTELLLRAGAPIQDLNAVRIPLSRVKGGGLRQAAPRARFVTLLLSDVLGNDPRVIASGPTVPTSFHGANALALLKRYELIDRVPASVRSALERVPAAAAMSNVASDRVRIVGDNAAAVAACADAARSEGHRVEIVLEAAQGEARELAVEFVNRVLGINHPIELVLGGGEATVTVRGDGVGGRNTEFALAAALELQRLGRRDWVIASLATDGQDALTGVAGAIASVATLQRARLAGIHPEQALETNDSLAVFRAAGGCVETGPTGTNVNDVYLALRITG